MRKIYITIIVLIILGATGYFVVFYNLPDTETILKYRPTSTIINFDGISWKRAKRSPVRKIVPLSKISKHLRLSVIISEDDTFYRHSGINYDQVKLAFNESLEKKRLTRGASTITMQLARNAFLTKERTLVRKLKEIIVARRIEKLLSKSKILELYLNIIEWGPNIYGAEAASRFYFDKSAANLNLAESSLLAAIIINPIRFNPYWRFNSARKLQRRVLKLMKGAKIITSEEMENILSQQIILREP